MYLELGIATRGWGSTRRYRNMQTRRKNGKVPDCQLSFNYIDFSALIAYIRKNSDLLQHTVPSPSYTGSTYRSKLSPKIIKPKNPTNMNFFTISMILALIACAMAFPTIDDYKVEAEDRADRHRRVTCDLLSWGGVVGDSACAANCLSMGKAGGSCNGAICVCRKTTFSELWNKRFG